MLWNRFSAFLKSEVMVWCLLSAMVLLGTRPCLGVEEVEKFMNRLAESGYSDLGVYYLEQQKAAGKLPEKLEKSYDYQMARLLVGTFNLITGIDEQLKEYDRAIGMFEKFIKEQPTSSEFGEAVLVFPRVLLDRANVYNQLSKNPSFDEAARKGYLEKCRADLNRTVAFLDEQVKRLLEAGKKLDPKSTDAAVKAKYEDIAAQLNMTRFSRADAVYELSRTYPDGSKEKMEALEKARAAYNFFWNLYAERGLYVAYNGRLREGQVLIEMKKFDKAAGTEGAILILTDFVNALKDMTDEPSLCDLFLKASASFIECFTYPENKLDDTRKQYIAAIWDKWKEMVRKDPELSRQPTGVQLQLNYMKYLDGLIKADPESAASTKMKTEIVNLLKPIAKAHKEGPFADQVAELVKTYNPAAAAAKETSITFDNYQEVTKYADLQVFADNQWNVFTELQSAYAAEANPENKAKMLDDIKKMAEQLLPVFAALERLKGQMITRASNEQILLRHRYCRAYLYYYAGRTQEAIILLDIITRKFPASQNATGALNLELQLYPGLIQSEMMLAKNAGKKPEEVAEYVNCELEGMTAAAQLKAQRLKESETPDDPKIQKELISSWASLCTAYVRVGNIDKAKEFLEKIPEDNDARGDAEVSVGFALWKMYVAYIRAEEDAKPYTQAQAEEFRAEAMKFLEGGVSRLKKLVDGGAVVNERMVSATITLCQILTQTGDNTQTLAWLNDEKVGPYTLYKAENAVTANFKQPILNCALQAFVAENNADEAEKVMNDLEKIASEGGDEGSEERLTMIYVKLGRELEDSLKQLTAEKNTEAVAKVQKGFEMFLSRIKERGAGNTFGSLMWVAQTYVSLADGIVGKRSEGAAISAAAKKYYEQGAETYLAIGKRCKDDPEFSGQADETKRANLQKILIQRVALCYVHMQEYEKAIQCYMQLLKENPGRLDLQVDAAEAFWAWAQNTEDKAEKLALIKKTRVGDGKFTNPKTEKTENAIWGWGRLSKMLQQFAAPGSPADKRQLYFLSQLRFAETNLAKAKAGDEKEKNLQSAFNVINRLFQLYDDMGGETADGGEYRDLFDRVLKEIQEQLGQPKRGIAGLVREVKEVVKKGKEWSVDELEEESLRTQEELARQTVEEERARRALLPPKKEVDPTMLYLGWGIGGVVVLILLFLMTRRKKSVADMYRQAELKNVTLNEVPLDVEIPAAPVAIEGVGEAPVADAGQAIDMFASMGIGDKPVVFDKDAEAAPVNLAFDFGAAPVKKEAPAKKPAPAKKEAPAKKPAPVKKEAPAKQEAAATEEKAPVKKPVSKPAAGPEGKPVVRKPAAGPDGKPVVRKPAPSAEKPAEKTTEKPAEKPAEKSAEKPAEKKVVRVVKAVKPVKPADKPEEK
ncbi:MAG: tetratricopeptide repeat protein [Planctomycetia bacterium]|nr:tetratricopeptide repeat protein [Planctomycetia bacterium]